MKGGEIKINFLQRNNDANYTSLEHLADDIRAAIEKYKNTVPLALAIGVLEIVKHELIERHD